MKRGQTRQVTEPDLRNIEMHGALCPECSHEVFTSATSAVVMCPECSTCFAIDVPQDKGRVLITGSGQARERKIPKGLYAI